MAGEVFYDVNELVIAIGVIILLLLAIEVGYRVGDKVPPGLTDSAKSSVLAISGALFGLLALLLGFTFSMSLIRFEQRKRLVVQESNAERPTFERDSCQSLKGPQLKPKTSKLKDCPPLFIHI